MIKEQTVEIKNVSLHCSKPNVVGSTVYLMDCVEGMKHYPDKYFDLAVVDPPYRDESENQPTQDMRNNGMIKNFGNKPTAAYFLELFRVSQNQIIWGANNFDLPTNKGFLIYKKKTISDAFTMSMCEYAWINEGLSTVSKLFEYHPQDKNRIHPTQKPVPLYDWIFKHYSKAGQRVLDTHLGSQSSRIAADKAGLDFTGFEIDKEYYDLGEKRFKQYKSQLRIEGW